MDYQHEIADSLLSAGRLDPAVEQGDLPTVFPRARWSRPNAPQQRSPGRHHEELLAMVCHELRSPLASVRHAVRLLGKPAPESAERRQLQAVIERQAGRMSRLIDDLLDVTHVTTDRMRLRCERLDLRLVVAHAVETATSEIEARGHQLVTSAPDRPAWVNGDAFRLEQVFVNLLANAAKYTEHGGRLAIRTDLHDNQAIVRISDSGVGIAPQLLPYIFDLYRQAEQANPQSRAGLGIGLAIVRSLVEQHGGQVAAASSGPGHGSEFTVYLPQHS